MKRVCVHPCFEMHRPYYEDVLQALRRGEEVRPFPSIRSPNYLRYHYTRYGQLT
jgi:hypothetical protein